MNEFRTIRGVLLDYTGVMTEAIQIPGNSVGAIEDELSSLPSPEVDFSREPGDRIRARMSFELRNPDPNGTWNRLERGEIPFSEFLAAFGAVVQVDMVPFGDVMGQLMSTLAVRPDMVDRVRQLKGVGLRTALLTNNVREWRPMWEAKLREAGATSEFDAIMDSSEIGMRKPEQQVFLYAADRMGLAPKEILFVDDFSHNVAGAYAVGMQVLQATSDDAHFATIDALLASRR